MKRWKPDFSSQQTTANSWYDLREDWSLVESSIASQYGIRLRQNPDMPWSEFTSLVSGLLPDTPLGAVVQIRSEQNPDVIKNFNSDQRAIYNKWQNRIAAQQLENPETLERSFKELSNMLKNMFGEANVEVN